MCEHNLGCECEPAKYVKTCNRAGPCSNSKSTSRLRFKFSRVLFVPLIKAAKYCGESDSSWRTTSKPRLDWLSRVNSSSTPYSVPKKLNIVSCRAFVLKNAPKSDI